MRTGHIKVKKGTHHLFYMAIQHHTTESVCVFSYSFILKIIGHFLVNNWLILHCTWNYWLNDMGTDWEVVLKGFHGDFTMGSFGQDICKEIEKDGQWSIPQFYHYETMGLTWRTFITDKAVNFEMTSSACVKGNGVQGGRLVFRVRAIPFRA